MGIFNEILVGRFNRSLQKAFGIKGSPPVRQLGGEITPAVQIASGIENRYLEAWNRWLMGSGIGPVAAINSTLRLRNPLGSNIIAVIEKATFSESVNDLLRIGFVVTNADLGVFAVNAANRVDPRQQSVGPNLIISTTAALQGSLISSYIVALTANVAYELIQDSDHQIPLLPGSAIDFWANTVNTQLNASVLWRERYLEE